MELKKKTKKAASLTEVMIVLGIISTALVTSVSVLASSLVSVKSNEIQDASNTLMIQALEVAKSPLGINLTDPTGANNSQIGETSYYRLTSVDGINALEEVSGGALTNCSTGSAYNVQNQIDGELSSYIVCLQIEITPQQGLREEVQYEIVSRTIYQVPGGEFKTNVIKGIRYNDFNEI